MIFTNPIGLWSLLAIPVLLGIYFLRRRPLQIPVSVLFLIEHAQAPSRGGRSFERLRTPPPFWLQLLALLLLAALLAGFRMSKMREVGRIAVVFDSSASVSAFREPLFNALEGHLHRLTAPLYAVELVLLESKTGAPRLYRGDEVNGVMLALEDFQPMRGDHHPQDALRLARGIVGEQGLVLFVTDRPRKGLPDGVTVLAGGEPVDNLGFAGMRATHQEWSAVIKNYADKDVITSWSVERNGTEVVPPRSVEIPRGGMVGIGGKFSEGILPGEGMTLRLPGDRFQFDDRLPIARPQPKVLSVGVRGDDPESVVTVFIERLVGSLLHVVRQAEAVDLVFSSAGSGSGSGDAVIFAQPGKAEVLRGEITPVSDALVEGIPWGGLVPFPGEGLTLGEEDRVLLWVGERAVVALRGSGQGGGEQLLIDLDLHRSNAARLPALALLVHRFTERVRERTDRPSAGNVEVGQLLPIVLPEDKEDMDGGGYLVQGGESTALLPGLRPRAPLAAGFFQVTDRGGVKLFSGAAGFADIAEADLREAGTLDEVPKQLPILGKGEDGGSREWRWLLILALLFLMAAWAFSGGSQNRNVLSETA